MPARLVVALVFLALIVWFSACSSGLGNNLPARPQPTSNASDNLPVGVDLGVIPTDPAAEPAVAGFVIPAFGGNPAREIVALAFSTAAAANDGDGSGTPISRDPTSDGNGARDVFVAAVSAQDIEQRAFSQSLAGKFRHPRCTTCHSMQAATTQAFASSPLPHVGPPPGPGFPNNDPTTCIPCHTNGTTFPVVGWQAPAASFDMRTETVEQIADRATRIPTGDTEHFVSDARVLWALDSGILPTVGGRNGAADDDHDGVLEPEDEDGVPRTVPGGSVNFIREIEAWNASGRVVTAAAAVKDVTLVSRANATNAGNGASSGPRLVWVPNPGFNPATAVTAANTNPVGTLHLVFVSAATNLTVGDANGAGDVYRALVQVRVEEDANSLASPGGINLVYLDGSTVLVSARNGTTTAGNGESTRPAIGGANGELVAFQSAATDLIAGFTDANGAGADVFLRRLGSNATELVSHAVGNTAIGGNGSSEAPAIDATAAGVAFESDASDLVADDQNGQRDVFHTLVGAGSPFQKARSSVSNAGAEALGGASSAASIHVGAAARVLVAFQSDATNLAPSLLAPTNVFLFDSATGLTTLLNQRLSSTGDAVGNGLARAPMLTADGSRVAFASAANNIDVLRSSDGNRAIDIFLVEVAQLASGNVLPFRVSMTATEGADADGSSGNPVIGSFTGSTNFQSGFLAYATAATNLGTTDSTNLMVSFLDETSGVFADFTASTTRGAVPLSVTFTDASSGSPTAWEWDFDNDGTIDSTAQNPTFAYATPGTYSVRLVARNTVSNGTRTETDLILAVTTPDVEFTASTTSGTAPLAVTFTDQSTQSPTSWQWDFENDGIVDSTEQNPLHSYPTPGTYDVRLVATNEAGSTTETKAGFVQAFAPVVANFSALPTAGIAPLLVNFTDLTTGNPTSWAWDFENDGITDSTLQNPGFTYTSPGTYTVRLTATGPGGTDVEIRNNLIVVSGPVVANFTANATSQYNNVAVTFTDLTTGSVSSWAWDFQNDGITDSVAQNPSFVFSTPGVYSVRLTASGPGGTDDELKTNFITSVPSSISVTIEAAKDTSIYSNVPGNSSGANQQLVCGRAYNLVTDFGIRRALVEFDVSSIPSASTILAASLQLTCTYAPLTPTGVQTISIHRVTREWTEGTTMSATPAAVVGGGAVATGGDATWDNATSGGGAVAWTNAGGDFNGSATRSAVVDGLGVYNWTNSAAMRADVTAWLNGANNHGWILRSSEVVNTRTAKVFGSVQHPTAASRPKLNVTYRPPLN